jgi:LCP family protein required for cell wall assembly
MSLEPGGPGENRELPRRPRRPRRSWRQRLILTVGIVASTLCFATVAFVGYEAAQLGDIERQAVALAEVTNQEPQNWLIVGSDSREAIARNDPDAAVFRAGGDPGGKRSDTIMIVRVDPAAEHLDILSLQRDLWVPIARTGESERINTAYNYPDGPQRLIDTIKGDFNIDINHYVEINFASFEGIVNAVGGVPMYFDKPLRDVNSGLQIDKTGCVRLDGYQALAFARSRHLDYREGTRWVADQSADLGRISRQQFFIRTMFDRVSAEAANPLTLNDLVGVAKANVRLDQQIDLDGTIALGKRFGQFKGDAIRSYSLPIKPDTTDAGAAILRLVEADAPPILNRFRGLADGEVAPESLTISVENGSGVANQATEVQQALSAIGYGPGALSDSLAPISRTQIRYGTGARPYADQLARHLSAGADLVEDAAVPANHMVLVTGKDFTTVMKRASPPTSLPTEETGEAGSVVPSAGATASMTTSTIGKRATTSTASPLNNTDSGHVGYVPGQPPPGVVCE